MDRESMKRAVESRKKENEERHLAMSKRNLSSNINKKIKTTMIGSLSKFEEFFGFLWGHGKKEHELTEEERRFRGIWDLARTEVLNNGNNQIRAITEELKHHIIKYEKPKTFFGLKDGKDIIDERN